MNLVLPYPPSANRYWRMWQGRMVVSTEARNYKEQAGWHKCGVTKARKLLILEKYLPGVRE